jgi:hypothetical protein
VLAHKAVKVGFYWPNMSKDSMVIVQNGDKCQRFANVTKQPPEELSSISSPRPFSQWGGRYSGTLTPKKGAVRLTIVAVDYFTKWAKAEAMVNIKAKGIERFL